MEDAHAKTVDEVQNFFNVDPEKGLTLDQVKRNQAKYGPNGMYKLYSVLIHKFKMYLHKLFSLEVSMCMYF